MALWHKRPISCDTRYSINGSSPGTKPIWHITPPSWVCPAYEPDVSNRCTWHGTKPIGLWREPGNSYGILSTCRLLQGHRPEPGNEGEDGNEGFDPIACPVPQVGMCNTAIIPVSTPTYRLSRTNSCRDCQANLKSWPYYKRSLYRIRSSNSEGKVKTKWKYFTGNSSQRRFSTHSSRAIDWHFGQWLLRQLL